MNRLIVITFALVFPLVVASPASEQKRRRQRNRPPSIVSFTSSSTTIHICPFVPIPVSGKPEVHLIVDGADPDGDALHYEYSNSEGTISGKGTSVLWNLEGLPRGPHTIRVTVSDGKGGKADAALTVTTVDATICDRPPPPCPVIKVSCPDEMDKSKPFTFSAAIEKGAKGYTPLSYYWKLNAGRIAKGQHTREIEATTTDALGFDSITATVEVGGFDPSCITSVSCTTKIIW